MFAALELAKEEQAELNGLKEMANNLTRVLGDAEGLKQDVQELERGLMASESTRSIADVEKELQQSDTQL